MARELTVFVHSLYLCYCLLFHSHRCYNKRIPFLPHTFAFILLCLDLFQVENSQKKCAKRLFFENIFMKYVQRSVIKLEVCRFKVIGKTHRDGRNVAMITGSKNDETAWAFSLLIEAWYRNHSGVDFSVNISIMCVWRYFCGYEKVAIWGVNEETKRAQGRIWFGISIFLVFYAPLCFVCTVNKAEKEISFRFYKF